MSRASHGLSGNAKLSIGSLQFRKVVCQARIARFHIPNLRTSTMAIPTVNVLCAFSIPPS